MGSGRLLQRRTVRELLTHAKDAAELMIDLAYAAVFYGDPALAREVRRLESSLDDDLAELREVSILAARTPEDAAGLGGVIALGAAIETIADAAEDIATITLRNLGVPSELRADLRHAAEVVTRVKVADGSVLAGASLRDLELPAHTGMWVIAVRRGDEYSFGPGADFSINAEDAVMLQGPEEGVAEVRRLAGAAVAEEPEPPTSGALTNLARAVDLCIELKDASETAVGLAYSAILLGDRSLADQVAALETRTDRLFDDLERWALEAAKETDNPVQLRGLFHMAAASERIADAARGMTRLLEGDEPPHPIIAHALGEAEEVVADVFVCPGSEADGSTVRDLRIQTSTGMEVLAIERGHRWLYRPRGRQRLMANDRLLVLGPEEGLELLRQVCGDPRPADETELRFETADEDGGKG